MPIPPIFNDTELVQSVIRRYVNKLVKLDFKDLDDANGNWEPEVSSWRGRMRTTCMHKDNDSLELTLARLFVYYFIFGKAQALQPAIIGVQKESFDQLYDVAYRPQVTLFFKQDSDAVPPSYYPITAEISFRLMNETTESLTEANVKILATKIKNELAIGQGFDFDKGKYLCKYYDKEKGYDLQIYAINEAEGERVTKKILSIRNHTFVETNFRVTVPRKASVNVTGTINILGKLIKKQRWRPTAKVRFLFANLVIYGKPEPIYLVDRTGKKRNPIEKAY